MVWPRPHLSVGGCVASLAAAVVAVVGSQARVFQGAVGAAAGGATAAVGVAQTLAVLFVDLRREEERGGGKKQQH